MINRWMDEWRAYPLLMIAVYGLAAYIALLSLTSLFPALAIRLETGSWFWSGDRNDPMYEFGTSFGYWGAIFFTLGMVLSTRAPLLERWFHGLDKVYRVHAFVGKIALLFIGAHMVILVLQAFPDANLLREYLLPGVNLSYTLGLFGTIALFGLVVLTLWVKIPYHRWLQTHRWMGLPFLAGTAHALVLQNDWYMWAMTAIGGGAWVYMLWFYERTAPQMSASIVSNTAYGTVQDLLLQLDRPFRVEPGQFIFLSVSQSQAALPNELHPFSVSGVLSPQQIRLSIKALGDYTRRVPFLVKGDRVTVYGPYGTFGETALKSDQPMIWIAGGIGITPFLALLQAEPQTARPSIRLIWSVRNEQDAVYADAIRTQIAQLPHVEFVLHITEHDGLLTAQTIAARFPFTDRRKLRVFLCGPVPMMHALTRQWVQQGVPRHQIISEEFALRP